MTRIKALVAKGNPLEAGLALRRLQDVKPDFGPQFVDWLPFVDASWNDFLKAGLRSAGMN